MRVHTAQLAGGDGNADRVWVTDQAVVLLDGATAFEPGDIDPDIYVEMLGAAVVARLGHRPDAALADVVAAAIGASVARLGLFPGRSPSSTVTIVRIRDAAADLYVLGDSPIHYGTDLSANTFTDHRLAAVALDEQARYVGRLRDGNGFDRHHRAALVALQRAQRAARNVPTGYWIAEADPAAAHHALTRTLRPGDITWAVLATDGAAEFIDHVDLAWSGVARCNGEQLAALLQRADDWESEVDRDGRLLPRPKRHDDKTIAVIPDLWWRVREASGGSWPD
jgi:hypothetical protein